MLKQGAANLVNGAKGQPASRVIDEIYLKALGRKPDSEERGLAEQIIGNPVQKKGVEDLLWAIVMLPEYQLIY
jgi:hypothetical protein